MGSLIRKAGYLATAAVLALGVSAHQAGADRSPGNTHDMAQDVAHAKALYKVREQKREKSEKLRELQHAKSYRGMKITETSVPCTSADPGAALATAWGNAAAGTINKFVLGACTYTLPATAPLATTAGYSYMIDGVGASTIITATTATDNLFTLTGAGSVLRVYDATLRGAGGTVTGNGGLISVAPTTTVTVTSGVAVTSMTTAVAQGGATLTVYNCTLRNGTASGNGGAIYATAGTVDIYNSFIRSNAAANGAGVYSDDGTVSDIYNTQLFSNTATTNGGGLYFDNGITYLTNSWLYNNGAADGAGTYNGVLGLMNGVQSLWSDNEASSDGGALYNAGGFYGSAIGLTGNSATTNGGGVYNQVDAAGTINAVLTIVGGRANSYINNNSATAGGGINNANALARANVSGTTFSGNTPNNCTNVTGC